MEKRTLLSVIGVLVFVILSLSAIIATGNFNVELNPSEITLSGEAGETVTTTFNIANNNASNLTDISITFTNLEKGSDKILSSNITYIPKLTSISAGDDEDVTIQIDIPENQKTGEYNGIINISGKIGSDEGLIGTIPLKLTVEENKNFCEFGNEGRLSVKIDDINVISGFGDDEEFWYLYDEIEVKIEVENKGKWDIKKIGLKWGLYNTEENDFIIDDKEKNFNLDADDEKLITIKFKLDEKIKKYADGDTVLYVWATGTIDDKDAGALDKTETCAQESQKIPIITDEEFVIIDNIEIPESVSCDAKNVEVIFNVINIGNEEQKDVFVVIKNTELGINEQINVGDLGDFDKEEFTTVLAIPSNAEEKNYQLELSVYDEDGDMYENDENDKSRYLASLKVLGECTLAEPEITATLDSPAEIGKELVISAEIKNNGESASFIITAEAYDSWATLNDIKPSIITINKGETKQVVITLTPTESGTQTFKINAIYNGKVAEQEVQVDIAEKTGTLTGAFAGLGNTGLYIIAVIFLVLIIIIIVLIIKVSSGPKADF